MQWSLKWGTTASYCVITKQNILLQDWYENLGTKYPNDHFLNLHKELKKMFDTYLAWSLYNYGDPQLVANFASQDFICSYSSILFHILWAFPLHRSKWPHKTHGDTNPGCNFSLSAITHTWLFQMQSLTDNSHFLDLKSLGVKCREALQSEKLY